MSEERWVAVPGHEGYEASDQGRVRSYRTNNRLGPAPFLLRGSINDSRYIRVGLDRRHPQYLHTVILETFVGPRPDGHEAAHLNGNLRDNRLANLAWVTPKVNGEHRAIHGTQIRGEASPVAALTDERVRAIRGKHEEGWSTRELGREFGVSQSTVMRILKRESWAHVL